MSDFDRLHSRRYAEEVQLLAFDLLEPKGEDLRPDPLERRKGGLAKLLHRSRDGIQMVEHMEAPGENVVEHACTLGLEGSCRSAAMHRIGTAAVAPG